MAGVLLSTWPLMLGLFMLLLGNGLQNTLLGVRGGLEGFAPAIMGLVMGAYSLGFLVACHLTPKLIRKVGHVRVFAAMASLVSAAFVLFAVFVDPVVWGVLRFLVGVGFASIYVVSESWLNATSTNEARGKSLSLYSIVQMAGLVAGQIALSFGNPGGFELFALISVTVSLSFAPILLSAKPAPRFEISRPLGMRALYQASPLGALGILFVGAVQTASLAMLAVYGTTGGFSTDQIALTVMAVYLGGMIGQYPITGWLYNRMDRRLLFALTTGAGAVLCVLHLLFDMSFTARLVLFAALGATSTPIYALLVAHVNDQLEPEIMPSASGGLVFLYGIGAISGPVGAGWAMRQLGPDGYFWFMGLAMLLIAFFTLYRMNVKQRAVPLDDLVPIQPVTARSTLVGLEICQEIAAEDALAE